MAAGVAGLAAWPADATPAAPTPTTIVADELDLDGLDYNGVVDLSTPGGSVEAMEFTVDGLELSGDVHVSVPGPNGHPIQISAPELHVDQGAKLFLARLEGELELLFFPVDLDFTPDDPPPLTFDELELDDVTIELYMMEAGKISMSSLSLTAGGDTAE